MPRYRIATFGKAVGAWLPTIELAAQDAVERGDASRDPFSGRVTLSVGASIEEDAADVVVDPDLEAWGKALVFLRQHREAAQTMAREAAADSEGEARDRWRDIARRIDAIMADAQATAQRESDA